MRAGLESLEGTDADAALVSLVDLPDVTESVIQRVLAAGADRFALIRTTYDGRPGHPVIIGQEHWFGVRAAAVGDRGARDYLANHALVEVECGDLATGRDVDEPAQFDQPSDQPSDQPGANAPPRSLAPCSRRPPQTSPRDSATPGTCATTTWPRSRSWR